MFSFHPNPNRGSHKILSLPQKQEGEKKLKRSQEKGNWTGFRSIKRDELKLVNVKVEWQAAPGVMSCTRQAVEQATRGAQGQARKMRLGLLLGHRMR